MNRKCVNCINFFPLTPKTRNRKYCSVCKILIAKQQRNTRKDFDLFCLDCNFSLPLGSKGDKMYCVKCLRIHRKEDHKRWHIKKTMKGKLNKFYKNLQFNLIQSPYFVEQKTLNTIILLENKWVILSGAAVMRWMDLTCICRGIINDRL